MTGVDFLPKNKFISSLFTTFILIVSLFFVLSAEINIFLAGLIVIVSIGVSELLAKKLFSKFDNKNVSPPTIIGSYLLLFLIAFYFIELYS